MFPFRQILFWWTLIFYDSFWDLFCQNLTSCWTCQNLVPCYLSTDRSLKNENTVFSQILSWFFLLHPCRFISKYHLSESCFPRLCLSLCAVEIFSSWLLLRFEDVNWCSNTRLQCEIELFLRKFAAISDSVELFCFKGFYFLVHLNKVS